jgi:type IV pilus assembly protein PilY1
MDSYWQFSPSGACTAIPAIGTTPAEPLTNAANSNRPDGNIVEKGAQAYVLRGDTSRIMKTCSTTFSSCTSLNDFNTSNVSPADLGLASTDTAQRDVLVRWARGLDTQDEDTDGVTATSTPTIEMRPSAHGDVVHSRPVAINFGTDASPRVVVFYGGNDGVLRAVNGNRTATVGGVAAGDEFWSFMPPEFYTKIKRLKDNTPQIDFKGNTITTPAPLPKPYGIDGPITVSKDATRAWIFAGMRRGGRVLYAFDVTGIANDSPAAPSLLWKKGCPNLTDDTNCSSGYSHIGQTWSSPKVIKAAGYVDGSGNMKPMLVMGGGYDACEDADPKSCDSSRGGTLLCKVSLTGPSISTQDRGQCQRRKPLCDKQFRAAHAPKSAVKLRVVCSATASGPRPSRSPTVRATC